MTSRSHGRLTGTKLGGWLAFLMLAMLGTAFLALFLGVKTVSISSVLSSGTLDHTIVFEVRLPRIVLGLIVGGALGAAGATLQGILRNPLADPFVLGVSGGAALGATLAIVAGTLMAGAGAMVGVDDGGAGLAEGWLPAVPVSLAAAMGALASTMLMLFIARAGGRTDPFALLLAGVVFNAFAAATILFLRTLVTPDEAHALLPWLVGNLGHRSWAYIATGGALAGLGGLILIARSSRLNLLSTGEESAATLGVDVDKTRFELVLIVSLMVGATVSLAGLVGFIGLVVPHTLRLLMGPDHRLLLPASILGGATFLVGCDLVSRLAFLSVGTEPPVGVITALIGAPTFLVLLRRSAMKGGA